MPRRRRPPLMDSVCWGVMPPSPVLPLCILHVLVIPSLQGVLNALDFCRQFPVDCRLVAQALQHACFLGLHRQPALTGPPLCVLVDIAALQRRPGVLTSCLHWLRRLPNLRAVRFADGSKGSMLDEEELGVLLQLVAARPEAAASLQHIGIYTNELGLPFDAGETVSAAVLAAAGAIAFASMHDV